MNCQIRELLKTRFYSEVHSQHMLAHFALIVARLFFAAIAATTIRAILPFLLRLCECFLLLNPYSIKKLHASNQETWNVKCKNVMYGFYLNDSATATAHATVQPTIGLFPMPIKPIISTCAGTEELPANCASECIRPSVSVKP